MKHSSQQISPKTTTVASTISHLAKILIIGAGLAGLSTAYHIEKYGLDYLLVESDAEIGGLCSTKTTEDGFVFDKTLHVLHLKTPYGKQLISELSNNSGLSTLELERVAKIYFEGDLIPYPFQSYYSLLSNKQVVKECSDGIKQSLTSPTATPQNFEQYVKHYFGEGIAKYFMLPYNEKLWTLPAKELSVNWADRFVPKPDYSKLITFSEKGVDTSKLLSKEWGYNPRFLYPQKGGIQAIANSLFSRLSKDKVVMSREVKKIDVVNKVATLSNGEKISFDFVISTVPLFELLKMVSDSQLAKNISNNLSWISVFNLNFGLNQKASTNAHWIYFPNKEFIFYRVALPSNLSNSMVPTGCSSLSVEVSYSKYRSLGDVSKMREEVIRGLLKAGLIKNRADIQCELDFNLKYAYVIYDKYHADSVMQAHDFLTKYGIFSIGRFGYWEYSAMEDALLEGFQIASKLKEITFSKI